MPSGPATCTGPLNVPRRRLDLERDPLARLPRRCSSRFAVPARRDGRRLDQELHRDLRRDRQRLPDREPVGIRRLFAATMAPVVTWNRRAIALSVSPWLHGVLHPPRGADVVVVVGAAVELVVGPRRLGSGVGIAARGRAGSAASTATSTTTARTPMATPSPSDATGRRRRGRCRPAPPAARLDTFTPIAARLRPRRLTDTG